MDEYLRDRQMLISKYRNLYRFLLREQTINDSENLRGQLYMVKQIIKDLEEKI